MFLWSSESLYTYLALPSNLTLEKKMVHNLPIPFTHVAHVNHNDVLLLDIVQGKDLSKSRQPSKEGHP